MSNKPAMKAAVDAAMSLATEIATGQLDPTELDALAQAEALALFTTVVGADDPLWPAQLEAARGVLALGGIPAVELSEWLAVTRAAEGPQVREPSWIEMLLEQLAELDDEAVSEL